METVQLVLRTAVLCGVFLSGCVGKCGFRASAPSRHAPKVVMGRDYWTMLYSYFFTNPGWDAMIAGDASLSAFDNHDLRELPVFRDCALQDFSCRPPPDTTTGLATWRTVKENFYIGNHHYEGMEACAKQDRPLQVIFGSKRNRKAFCGEITLDYDDYARWKVRHPNLTVFHTLSEWDNDVRGHIIYAHGSPKTNAIEEARRLAVRRFIGILPSNRYERVALQKKYFDRQVELYYGDRDHIGALHCSNLIGNLAAAWGAREIIVETTNTTSPGGGDNEMRWEMAAMFTRGAARQFNIPWGWYSAIFMNGFEADGTFVGDSVCNYPQSASEAVRRTGAGGIRSPAGGISRSLNRRSWYYGYLNGASYVQQEGWHRVLLRFDSNVGKIVLSPRGEDFAAFHDFTMAHPDRGTPYTPVAVLVPFAQGYAAEGGYPWRDSSYGYTAGDQAVDAVFFSIVPGFERGAMTRRGGEFNLHNTSMAMMYDVISPDAPQDGKELLDVFKSYRALVVVGDYPDRSFERQLSAYTKAGGEVVRIDPASLPDVDDKTVADIRSGRRRFPNVEACLKKLQDKFFPVKVVGDCQYGLNQTKTGLWLWCFNNKGITKFADREQVVDPSASSEICVDVGNLNVRRVSELLTGQSLVVENGSFRFVIPAGDIAVFELSE